MNSILSHQQEIVDFVRSIYGERDVPLHRPVFSGNEKQYLSECIDSNFVSSVGPRVTDFEQQLAAFTGSRFAVATANGTAALHVALLLAGVKDGDEVITQALTFVATCNALAYAHAKPVFIDVDRDSMGMSAGALKRFLREHTHMCDGQLINKTTGRRIAACVPMHTFGLPCRVEELAEVCESYGIPLIEDAAESLGSYVGERHTGTFGAMSTLSFNGNKVITTGGGGALLTDDPVLAQRAKHLTTTAKVSHPYEFFHDEVGYNYRLPNLNAALGCAQMEALPAFLQAKAEVARKYEEFFGEIGIPIVRGRDGTTSNYWLNAVLTASEQERDAFLQFTNSHGVMTRPIWKLMTRLPMFRDAQNDGLENSLWLEQRVVNLPSSVPDGALDPEVGK